MCCLPRGTPGFLSIIDGILWAALDNTPRYYVDTTLVCGGVLSV